jgi:hypothetical protein
MSEKLNKTTFFDIYDDFDFPRISTMYLQFSFSVILLTLRIFKSLYTSGSRECLNFLKYVCSNNNYDNDNCYYLISEVKQAPRTSRSVVNSTLHSCISSFEHYL